MTQFDAIVIGAGGVGSAALYHLARRGHRVLGIDRFAPPHDRGSSHGQTRIIRQAYFEHRDYVPLVLRSFDLWREVEAATGETLFSQVGLLEVGPADGVVVPGVLASAERHRLDVQRLTAADIERRFRGFRVPADCVGVFEAAAGFLHVERCVAAHLQLARQAGATLQTDTAVLGWSREGSGFVVATDRGVFRGQRLVITAGPLAETILPTLGVPFEVRRKPLYWFDAVGDEAAYHADGGCPTFLYELPDGVFYGFPRFDERGVKVARHSGGDAVADAASVDRSIDEADRAAVAGFTSAWLPGLAPRHREFDTCLYTMSPDEHFIVDVLPDEPRVAFAAGLSGHGYKFAPVLGEILADWPKAEAPTIQSRFYAPAGSRRVARVARLPVVNVPIDSQWLRRWFAIEMTRPRLRGIASLRFVLGGWTFARQTEQRIMAEKRFLTADWRHLLVLNYEVDPALLAEHVPPGTQLDYDDGRCFVSLVAFRFERTRVLGVPIPWHTSFPEVNLRFYVRCDARDGVRRGVVFLRELVNRRAVAAAANWAYNENYRYVPIRADLSLTDNQIALGGTVRYEWRAHGRVHQVAARRSQSWRELDPSSHEAFIAEHYFGYGVARDGRTIEYRVDHPPWRTAEARDVETDVDWTKMYGASLAATFRSGPYSAFLLDGSPVTVFRPTYLRPQREAERPARSQDLLATSRG